MQKFVETLTEQFLNKLPQNQTNYSKEDLESFGYPAFFIERTQVDLWRNLGDSINHPETEWADMGTPSVLSSWNKFLTAIKSECRLPKEFARAVFENVLEDIMEQMVTPRMSIPEIIFANEDVIQLDDVEEALLPIVVNKHLASFLPSYMAKKSLNSISKDRFIQAMIQVDTILISRYTPLNWAQVLQPLFDLFKGKIDGSLLQTYFNDKGLKNLSNRFSESEFYDQSAFIEIISQFNPDDVAAVFDRNSENIISPVDNTLIDEEDITNENEELIEPEISEAENLTTDEFEEYDGLLSESSDSVEEFLTDTEDDEIDEEASLVDSFSFDEENESAGEDFTTIDESPEELTELAKSESDEDNNIPKFEDINEKVIDDSIINNDGDNEVEDDDDDDQSELEDEHVNDDEPLFKAFSFDEEPDEIFKPNLESEQDEESIITSEFEDLESNTDDLETQDENDSDDVEEPMWKRFAIQDTEDVSPVFEPDKPVTEIEEPNLFRELASRLEDQRSDFINNLFNGDRTAYNEALEEFTTMKNWRIAGKYLTNEVFRKNKVDMYSEVAAEFTDRLHKFFIDIER